MITKLTQLFRPLTPAEMRQRLLEHSRRELVSSLLEQETANANVSMLQARIRRLEREIEGGEK
jgi:hypothetical protein